MKREIFVGIFLFIFVLALSNGLAQSGPSWLIQGNLQDAYRVWDFLEIPNTNIILACGQDDPSWGIWAIIWKSTNGGYTWHKVLSEYQASEGFVQFAYDQNKNIVFVCAGQLNNNMEWKSIYYSTDQGENWTSIVHPPTLGNHAGARSIVLLNNKLYIAYLDYHTENGNNWGMYSAMLYRIDVSDYNPSNWYWEFLMQYPELDYLMRLAEKDGKLYVFGKDWNSNAIRVFTYDTQTLDRMAVRIGTVEEVRQQVELYQAQLAQQSKESPAPDNTTTVANPINEEAEK